MNTNELFEECPSVGRLLADYMSKSKKSPAALSRKMDKSLLTIIRLRKKESIQVSLLWKLSHIYRHNFLADIAAQLPPDYAGALQDTLAQKDAATAAVRDELAAMTKERDIYLNLLKK